MVILRKSHTLYFLDIRNVYPRVEGLVVCSPLDKMFNADFRVVCNILYNCNSVWGDTLTLKSTILKLAFDRLILQI